MQFSKILLFVLLAAVNGANADEIFKVYSDTKLQLGYGIEPLTEQLYEQCVDMGPDKAVAPEDTDVPKDGSMSSTNLPVKVSQITSYSQIDEFSSSSASASGSYGAFSGGFSYASTESKYLMSDRAAVGIQASADYGRWYLVNQTLKPEYRALAEKDINEFYARCGTEFVAGYRRGQSLKVMLSTSTQVTKTFKSVSVSVSAGVSAGAAGASFSGAFMNTASALLKLGSLEVHFNAQGAGKLAELSPLLKTDQDVIKFRDTIAEFMSKMKPENAIKTHYITRPYFPGRGYDPLLVRLKRDRIKGMYDDYRLLYDNQERMRKAFRNSSVERKLRELCDTRGAKNECDSYIDGMKNYSALIDRKLEAIRQAVHVCAHGSKVSDCPSFDTDHWEISSLWQITWPATFRYALLNGHLDEIRKR